MENILTFIIFLLFVDALAFLYLKIYQRGSNLEIAVAIVIMDVCLFITHTTGKSTVILLVIAFAILLIFDAIRIFRKKR